MALFFHCTFLFDTSNLCLYVIGIQNYYCFMELLKLLNRSLFAKTAAKTSKVLTAVSACYVMSLFSVYDKFDKKI